MSTQLPTTHTKERDDHSSHGQRVARLGYIVSGKEVGEFYGFRTDEERIAVMIVNNILDDAGVDVETRQRVNDSCDEFVTATLRKLCDLAMDQQAKRPGATELAAAVKALAYGESASAVMNGVVGTTPDTYSGVTKDEALDYAGELVEALRALVADPTRNARRPPRRP